MARHEDVASSDNRGESVETVEVEREIRLIRIGIGQLDVAEHVAGEQHSRIDDLDGQVTARVSVMLV